MRKTSLLTLLFCFSLTLLFSQKDKKEEKPKHFLDTLSLGFKWRSVGPALTSGRIADFAVDPANRAHYFVASASGGVWKTDNAGTTYESVFDAQGSFSIGCITMDPLNSNTLWVGTGENNNQRSVSYGDGIYRSNDGGKSWENMGLKQSEHIGKIIVHPTNSDIVWVAAIGPLWAEGGDRGVYKTTDGGKNWEQVLKIDENTGVTDLIIDPRNPDVLYAAAFQRRRHVFTWVGGGPGSGIYKTKDGGKSWAKANNGLPGVDMGRIGLAISPANPEVLYAIVEAAQGEGGFFKSTDRAASWEKQSGHTTSGNYYCELFPHPTNPDMVWSMDSYMSWTKDGGKSFQPFNEQWKHIDNHAMWFDPKDPNYILNGNDGGVYESFDGGKSWDFKSNLPVTQFYKVAVDNALPFYNIYGGTQDNFSLGGPSRTRNQHGIDNDDWIITVGGDGFESQIDPQNPNIVYAQSQHGVLSRFDKASGEAVGIQPKPREGENEYRWNWDSPLQLSAHTAERLYFCANKVFRTDDRGDSWTVISPDLTRQLDRNSLKVMGRVQSFEAVAKNQSTSEYGNIVAFCESPKDPKLLYVGTDDGLIQVTENGGDEGSGWTKVETFPGVPELTYVNYLLASQHDKNSVYAAFNNHKRGDFKPYLLKSTDKGKTWTSISANLPERGSVYCIAEDHVNPDLLFCGTEFGCFVTLDGGKYWKKLGNGLPTVAIRDMAIQKRENDLVLGTFGRGFYVLDDYSNLREISAKTGAEEGHIFSVKDGLVYVEAQPWGLRGKAFQGASFFTTPNPPVGVTFSYFVKNDYKTRKDRRRETEKKLIKDGKDTPYPSYAELEAERLEEAPQLVFTIRDAAGNVVRKLKTKPSKGVSRISWDGRFPTKTPVNLNPGADDLFGNPDTGPLAAPGDYTVSMSLLADGKSSELSTAVSFRLNALGGTSLPATDRAALLAFHKEAGEMQRQFSTAEATLGDMSNRLKYIRKAIDAIETPAPDLLQDVRDLEAQVRDLQKAFYGDGVARTLDKRQPANLSSRVNDVVGEIYSSTSNPTKTHRENLRLAREGLAQQMPKLNQLADKGIKDLERKLEAAGAPYTPGRRN